MFLYKEISNDSESRLEAVSSCLIKDNTFEYNLAVISNAIFIQGCTNIVFLNNQINHNSVPLAEYLDEGIFKNLGYTILLKPFNFDAADLVKGPYPTPTLFTDDEKNTTTMASPVIFHLAVNIYLSSCNFGKNLYC